MPKHAAGREAVVAEMVGIARRSRLFKLWPEGSVDTVGLRNLLQAGLAQEYICVIGKGAAFHGRAHHRQGRGRSTVNKRTWTEHHGVEMTGHR